MDAGRKVSGVLIFEFFELVKSFGEEFLFGIDFRHFDPGFKIFFVQADGLIVFEEGLFEPAVGQVEFRQFVVFERKLFSDVFVIDALGG